jgi:DNA uptake protein ComE-like DNA-binding protein
MIAGGTVMAAKKININTATKDELAALPMIGDERAETLIEQRPFYNWDELDELPGFDESLIQDIQASGGYIEEEEEEEEW